MIRTFCIAALLTCGIAIGQPAAVPQSTAQTKPLAFEVVSIRPSKPDSPWGSVQILPDGYHAWGIGLWATVAKAYFPDELYYPDSVQGEPAWMSQEKYDIEAKVAPADVAEWKRQSETKRQRTMLQAMLQQMLAERCKLVVHHTPASIAGYALVVGKHGPKLKESPPDEKFPPGSPLPDGGVAVGYNRQKGERVQIAFYGASMASFATRLEGMSFPHPVQDKTGLTGKYDFVLAWFDLDPDSSMPPGAVSLSDQNPLSHWDVGTLGLSLEPVKIPSETIVIDHIEKPSEN
jgi:uncharacterized protein (TIGR03435 family)